MKYQLKINLMNPNKIVGSFIELPKLAPTKADCDIVEIRLDAELNESALLSFLRNCPLKILLTARDLKEGGEKDLTFPQRTELLERYLPYAHYVDVEMRNWNALQPTLEKAKHAGMTTISSYHDFHKTPSEVELETLLDEAVQTGADIVKFAFMTKNLSDIERCQRLLFNHPERHISLMGMGAYAPASRLILAQSGSVLNYGFLGERLTAPGQWNASLLKKAIHSSAEIKSDF